MPALDLFGGQIASHVSRSHGSRLDRHGVGFTPCEANDVNIGHHLFFSCGSAALGHRDCILDPIFDPGTPPVDAGKSGT